jgi:uncharacterized protein (DUF2252 family)
MARGRSVRSTVPRSALGEWKPAADRPDPVVMLEEQSIGRLPELVPVRYGRMVSSPLAFLRGSAVVMAGDIAGARSTGLEVQACGDAHLTNFGVFATPERNVVFDLNDFDETLPAPFEFDVKRLAASLAVAGRRRGFDASIQRDAVRSMVRIYQTRMREFATMPLLAVWYSSLDARKIGAALTSRERRRVGKVLAKAETRDHLQAQSKLTEVVGGHRRIREAPPLVVRAGDEMDEGFVRRTFEDYGRSLSHDRRVLLARFRFVDVARKVVGVGSVGTRCLIALFEGRDDGDPLFLQVKEANDSVLERHVRRSRFRNHAQRVVVGQRMTQAASDIFLGWIRARGDDPRDFYWRQLRDVKGSADLETIEPAELVWYGGICGAALARAHARSGDAASISGYVGTGAAFARAIHTFSVAYADQTERDHAALVVAARDGRIVAQEGM